MFLTKQYVISATFRGKDGSMGYKSGESYLLLVLQPGFIDRQLSRISYKFAVQQWEGTEESICLYESERSLRENWKVNNSSRPDLLEPIPELTLKESKKTQERVT